MRTLKTAKWIILIIPIVFMWACSGGLEGGPSQDSDTGTLYLSLIDCPAQSCFSVQPFGMLTSHVRCVRFRVFNGGDSGFVD